MGIEKVTRLSNIQKEIDNFSHFFKKLIITNNYPEVMKMESPS